MFIFSLLLSVFVNQQFHSEIIDGYPDKLSLYPGDSLGLYINASSYSANHILRLYDLSENVIYERKASVYPQHPQQNAYENGFGYKLTCRVAIPNLPSGVYLWEKKIPIIVKARNAKITVVYSSNTANAYCPSGGKSLYGFNSSDRTGAQIVSFNRPIPLSQHSEAFFRWLHKENISGIGYVCDMDLDDFKSISKSELLIISGHSEYWTLAARKNFDRFVHSGGDAMVLSGNTMWWQVRYNKTKDQLICYRNRAADPVKNERLKTINWFEPSLQYPIIASIGTDFRNAGYGVKFSDNGWDGYKVISDSPLLEGTAVKVNDVIKLPSDELDGVPIASYANQIPSIDYQAVGFMKVEIVGYDLVQRNGKEGVATWIVFRSTGSSGVIINTASTDWCSAKGIGSNLDIQRITRNMIKKLMNDENVFSHGRDLDKVAN